MTDQELQAIIDRLPTDVTTLRRQLAETIDELEAGDVIHGHLEADIARLRAVLDAARVAAEAGQWTACRDALQGADHA